MDVWLDGWIKTCPARNQLGQIEDKHEDPKCGGPLKKTKKNTKMTSESINAKLSRLAVTSCVSDVVRVFF